MSNEFCQESSNISNDENERKKIEEIKKAIISYKTHNNQLIKNLRDLQRNEAKKQNEYKQRVLMLENELREMKGIFNYQRDMNEELASLESCKVKKLRKQNEELMIQNKKTEDILKQTKSSTEKLRADFEEKKSFCEKLKATQTAQNHKLKNMEMERNMLEEEYVKLTIETAAILTERTEKDSQLMKLADEQIKLKDKIADKKKSLSNRESSISSLKEKLKIANAEAIQKEIEVWEMKQTFNAEKSEISNFLAEVASRNAIKEAEKEEELRAIAVVNSSLRSVIDDLELKKEKLEVRHNQLRENGDGALAN